MLTLQALVTTYGYPALILGTFLEGETILVIGGFLAHRGYLDLPLVMLAAFTGTLAGDQLFFWLGRTRGLTFLERKPLWRPQVDKARALLESHQSAVIVGFRFLYGIRSVTPFAIGMSGFAFKKFVFLNAIGALVWAITVGAGGYLFGQALEIALGDVRHYECQIIVAMVGVGIIVWIIHRYRRKRFKAFAVSQSGGHR